MAMGDLPLFAALHRRGAWLAERQVVIAQNVANADTPDFQPRDLKPQRFRDLLDAPAGVALTTTAPAHLVPAGQRQGEAKSGPSRQVYETAPAGNAVVLEEQLAHLHETAIDHRTVTQLYRKFLGMLRTVATARG